MSALAGLRSRLVSTLGMLLATNICMSAALMAAEPAAATPVAVPATPPIARLEAFPKELELAHIRDTRRLLVTGYTADGSSVDLTSTAQLSVTGSAVRLATDGYVAPMQPGVDTITVSAAGLQTTVPVKVLNTSPRPVSFAAEIQPVMGKVGCNQGTCHGAQDGKAGFKLSLRGYDAEYDYNSLVDDLSGRRFDRSRPDQSLMLLKPTQGVPHVGGFLFDEQSRPYQLIQQWIAEGLQFDNPARVQKLEMFPQGPVLDREGMQQQLVVIAHYTDGSTRDVTSDAVFSSSDFNVASVQNTGSVGLVQALRRGETAILVRYEGNYVANNVTVLGDRSGYAWEDSVEINFIDKHVNDKLRRLKILPSGLCTDSEFLRRVSLDLTGLAPTGAQAAAFLADPRDSRTKRNAKIEELLASQDFVEHWTLKWCDLLLANRTTISEKGLWAFRSWIRTAIANNQPYDQFVSQLMTANGSTFENPAANYFRISREPRIAMENMTQVFIGTRFSCARCHDHPFERWTQNQYYELSAFFANVGRKPGTREQEEVIYPLRHAEAVLNPRTNVAVPAKFPYSYPGVTVDETNTDSRQRLAAWLVSKENPYFATSVVNRYWSYLLGRGIIDPVDDIRSSNPPSNPALLQELTQQFVASGMDLRQLLRTITQSATYQRSFESNRWNEDDLQNFSHMIPRRLTAEQLYDAIMVATGAPESIPGLPPGFRATQAPDPNVQLSFLDMFGRAPREIPCECERAAEVSLAQTLNLVNGPTVADAIVHPQGVVATSIAGGASNNDLITSVYLSTLNRLPTPAELEQSAKYMESVPDRLEAAQDLMWALLNSPAFLFNR